MPKKPLFVSVSGVEGTGITVACNRVAYCLNKLGVNTLIITLGTPKLTERWEDDVALGKYDPYDVIILIRHGFTHTAVKLRLSAAKCRFSDSNIRPDFAVLMICDDDTYGRRNNIHKRNVMHDKDIAQFDRLKRYRTLEWCHWGTKRIFTLDTSGDHGRLLAAGGLKHLILKELGHVKDAIA